MMNSSAVQDEMSAMTALAMPIESPEVLVRYKINVIRLCNDIREQRVPLSISFSCFDCAAASSLVGVDPRSNTLLLEYSSHWQRVQRVMAMFHGDADYSIMAECAFADSIVQFQCRKGAISDVKGRAVMELDIPDFMWRFQRRLDQRHKVSGLKVTLNLGLLEVDAEVADLGVGGIGMVTCDRTAELEVGQVLHNSTISLPGVGPILVDLTVRHQSPDQMNNGSDVQLVGCQFTGLSDRTSQLITHYLDALADC